VVGTDMDEVEVLNTLYKNVIEKVSDVKNIISTLHSCHKIRNVINCNYSKEKKWSGRKLFILVSVP
jgi:hypothetical protein